MNELTVLRDAYAQIKASLLLLDCYVSDLAPVYEGVPLLPHTGSETAPSCRTRTASFICKEAD